MCFGMVLIMSIYNTALHGFSTFTVGSAIIQFVITFIITFIAETFVEPKARKLALLITYDKSKEFNFIVALPAQLLIACAIARIRSATYIQPTSAENPILNV